MKFASIFASIVLLPTLALTQTVSFDQAYDNAAGSTLTVSCSNGPNGLVPLGFLTFGSIPHFPNIGGAAAVEGFDSVNCESCWNLTFVNSAGVANTISVLAIDHAASGFNIALGAMNTLTDGQAEFLGRVPVTSVQVDKSVCGL